MPPSTDDKTDLIEIGRIRRAVGLDGRVEIEVYSGDFTRFAVGTSVLVNGYPRKIKTSRAGGRGGALVVIFEGIEDRDAADAIRGLDIQSPVSDLPPAPEGGYYHFEIIGCQVKHISGETIGLVTGVMETGSNDVFVVERPDGKEALIPSTRDVIISIDRDNRLITIDPPDGLIS